MSKTEKLSARQRSDDFLKISGQFKLGALVTESSHPVTANLSKVAKRDLAQALDLLFQVDDDVIRKYREFVESGRAMGIKDVMVNALGKGGKLFFTGCGSTGRLSLQLVSIWRDFWQQQHACGVTSAAAFEDRAFSVMAGGDFALIKAVEGFEDFAAFGKKQIADLGVSEKDVVFAITEGGETSFVIGTAWKAVEVGAKVYFVYNNPDEILCKHVDRSREVIQDGRIEKINLTTGPMAITGSTRMQATSMQLAVMVTVMEMVVRDLLRELEPGKNDVPASDEVPKKFNQGLYQLMLNLRAPEFLSQLAGLVELEETVYRSGHKNNYFAERFGIDVLTDTTERSPTYCTPPFRKFDDTRATESWAFLYVPHPDSPTAWECVCKRSPRCVEWSAAEVRALVPEDKFARTMEIIGRIGYRELMRFRIGMDGISNRPLGPGDSSVAVLAGTERHLLQTADGFLARELTAARAVGARTGLICFGGPFAEVRNLVSQAGLDCTSVFVSIPPNEFLLKGLQRVAVKVVINALSTCTMVRLGRVMGNYMIWVVASNLKLIDRATRYIETLTGLDYEESNRLLFEAVEYVEPRMKADQAYPPVVGLAVLRARHRLTNEQAEKRLLESHE